MNTQTFEDFFNHDEPSVSAAARFLADIQAQYEDLTSYFENVPRVALAFTTVIAQRKKEMDQLISQNYDI